MNQNPELANSRNFISFNSDGSYFLLIQQTATTITAAVVMEEGVVMINFKANFIIKQVRSKQGVIKTDY